MNAFKCILFVFSLVWVQQSWSQIPIIINPDQAPSKIQWKQIKTDHFKIIYPKAIFEKAKKAALDLEKYYHPLKRNLNSSFDKITVVLQTESALSNAFVALAPWRSHWVMTPVISDRLGATEWLETLAIHEQRHMVQMQKYKKGFSKGLYIVFGETGQAISSFWSTPAWYFEGDAVVEETLLSKSGRGRLPDFTRHYRAQLLRTGAVYPYDKNYLGSFKNFTPNHYPLGFVLSNEMRRSKAGDITDMVVSSTAKEAWNPFALESYIARNRQSAFHEFYHQAFERFKNHFKARDQKIKPSPYQVLEKSPSFFSNHYLLGHYQDQLLVYRSGLAEVSDIALFDPKTKKFTRLFRTNRYLMNKVTVIQDQFVFQDITIHPRFLQESYSNIYLFDLKKKEKHRMTSNKRYFLPELSPKGEQVIALSFSKAFTPELTLLTKKGSVKKKITLTQDEVPISLNFDTEEKVSYLAREADGSFLLKELNLLTEKKKILYRLEEGTANGLRKEKDSYYFSSNFDGMDNIYSFSLKTKKILKLTDSRFGAVMPNIVNGKLFYNEYDLLGFRVVSKENIKESYPILKANYLIDEIPRPEIVHQKQAISVKPSKLKRDLVNIHSWSFLTSLFSPYQTLMVRSDDVLNELGLSTGLLYHSGEKSLTYFAAMDYQKYWPILHLRGEVGKRTIFLNYGQDNEQTYSWHQNGVEAGFTLPYRALFSGNRLAIDLTVLSGYRYISNKSYPADESNGELTTEKSTLSFSFAGEQSLRDIKPRFGLDFTLNHETTKTRVGNTPNAFLTGGQSVLYLPGLWSHHSFFPTFSRQDKSIGIYDLPDLVPFVRGYKQSSFRRFDKYTLNYSFPFLYPEWNLGRFLYFKRFRANLFYDYAKTSTQNLFRSYGLEILFDTHFFRNLFINLSWGVRSSKLLDDPDDEYNHELFLESEIARF